MNAFSFGVDDRDGGTLTTYEFQILAQAVRVQLQYVRH